MAAPQLVTKRVMSFRFCLPGSTGWLDPTIHIGKIVTKIQIYTSTCLHHWPLQCTVCQTVLELDKSRPKCLFTSGPNFQFNYFREKNIWRCFPSGNPIGSWLWADNHNLGVPIGTKNTNKDDIYTIQVFVCHFLMKDTLNTNQFFSFKIDWMNMITSLRKSHHLC